MLQRYCSDSVGVVDGHTVISILVSGQRLLSLRFECSRVAATQKLSHECKFYVKSTTIRCSPTVLLVVHHIMLLFVFIGCVNVLNTVETVQYSKA